MGCGGGRTGEAPSDQAARGGGDLIVFAAASLSGAFAELGDRYEEARPGGRVVFNIAGSSSLREQLLEGGPADLFASADESNVAAVVSAGLAVGEPVVFARNRLVLAVPSGNPAGVTALDDLSREDLLVGLCSTEVPCGAVAERALAVSGVVAAIDTREPDVRALTTKLAAGELDAALVYASDVVGADERIETVLTLEGPEASTDYVAVATAEGLNPEGAAAFVTLLVSDEGRTILANHGFEAP